MGETGPCGPCTEIHIDRTPDRSGGKLVNKGTPEVIEIWNLVFIQFNRGADGKLTPLPAKHVDTGMGFERLTAVLQNKASNYDTDVFAPIFQAIQKITKAPAYTGKLDHRKDTAYRVIADHIRALTFALTDGAVPSNEKRGYVLRSILRRAERFGRQYMGTKEPFLFDLVPVVVETMGGVFPELKRAPDKVANIIREEEIAFIRNFDRGLELFQKMVRRTKERESTVISGEDVFDLHTTYGFFSDITEQMAGEVGMTVDRARFDELMQEFKKESGKDRKKFAVTAVSGELPKTDDSRKYTHSTTAGKLEGWIQDSTVIKHGTLQRDDEAALILERTCFYAEQGGQIGDAGVIHTDTGRFDVSNTQRLGDCVLHIGQVVRGQIKAGQAATLEVSSARAHTMRNHTATHLLNWALRKVLGDHVEQRGSLVDAEKTRFDFTHDKPLSSEEIAEIERLVNEKLYADLPVTPVTMSLTEAKNIVGVRAVFGEKYPDPVRVLLIGPEKPEQATLEDSIEFCGGTHLNHTGQAGFFKIVAQELVGKGVRRVVAVTGHEAVATVQRLSAVVDDLAGRFNCAPEDLPRRVEVLQEEVKKLQAQLRKGAASDLAGAGDRLLSQAVEAGGAKIIVGEMPAAPIEQMRQQLDRLREKAKSAVVVIGWADEGKVGLLSLVTDDLSKKGLHSGKLIGEVAKVVGGKGGGPATGIAQAGGKDAAKLGEALQLAKKLAIESFSREP
jgi:alanyl-tRNA synthetase